MAAQVRPENRKVGRFIQFHPQIEEQGTITAITMQKDHGRRPFAASEEPTSGWSAVTIAPILFSYFQGPGRSTYLGESLRSDEVGTSRWPSGAVDNQT